MASWSRLAGAACMSTTRWPRPRTRSRSRASGVTGRSSPGSAPAWSTRRSINGGDMPDETPTNHYTIISADCHAGASHETYREYLDSAYLDDFDAWRGE